MISLVFDYNLRWLMGKCSPSARTVWEFRLLIRWIAGTAKTL